MLSNSGSYVSTTTKVCLMNTYMYMYLPKDGRQYITRALRWRRPPWPRFPIWRVSRLIQINQIYLINCSLYHCSAVLNMSLKFSHILLSNGWISDWTV